MSKKPLAFEVAEGETLPTARLNVSIPDAYAAVKALRRPGVNYRIAFDNIDGEVLRRFSRTLEFEAWLVARPIDASGSVRSDTKTIVCPMLFVIPGRFERRKEEEDALVTELAALTEQDAA